MILFKLVQTPRVATFIYSLTHTPLPLPLANALGLPGAKWALGNPRDVSPSWKMISGLKACVCTALSSLFCLRLSPIPHSPFCLLFVFSPFILVSYPLFLSSSFLTFFFLFFSYSSALGYTYFWISFFKENSGEMSKFVLVSIKIVKLARHYYVIGIVINIWHVLPFDLQNNLGWLIDIYCSYFP